MLPSGICSSARSGSRSRSRTRPLTRDASESSAAGRSAHAWVKELSGSLDERSSRSDHPTITPSQPDRTGRRRQFRLVSTLCLAPRDPTRVGGDGATVEHRRGRRVRLRGWDNASQLFDPRERLAGRPRGPAVRKSRRRACAISGFARPSTKRAPRCGPARSYRVDPITRLAAPRPHLVRAPSRHRIDRPRHAALGVRRGHDA